MTISRVVGLLIVSCLCVLPAAASSLSISSVSKSEGNAGPNPFGFIVTLDTPSALPVTVHWSTADSTARAGADYFGTSGDLVFEPGQTILVFYVIVYGDTFLEPNEIFYVNLSNPTNATITDGQGEGQIENDDSTPPTVDLTLVKSAPGAVTAGGSFTYTLDVTNRGPAYATDVTVTDPIPAGVHVTNVTSTLGTCMTTTVITCNVGSLSSQFAVEADLPIISHATITVTATGPPSGVVTNTAVATSSEPDTNPANNTSTATTVFGSSIPALDSYALLLLAIALAITGAFVVRRGA